MSRPIGEILQEVQAVINANPGAFQGLAPGNVIPHLGRVAPDLWNQLDQAYKEQGGGQGLTGAIAQGAATGTLLLPGIGTALGAGAGGLAHALSSDAPTVNEYFAKNSNIGQGLLSGLNASDLAKKQEPKPVEAPIDPNIAAQKEADARAMALSGRLDDLYGKATQGATDVLNNQYANTRRKTAAEEAALGRYRSPIASNTFNRLDQNKGLALSSMLGNIAGQRAAGELDVSKTIENVLNSNRQFNQDLGLRRETLSNAINQSNQDRTLSSLLGMQQLGQNAARLRQSQDQFDATKNDPLRYLTAALDPLSKMFQFKKTFGASALAAPSDSSGT